MKKFTLTLISVLVVLTAALPVFTASAQITRRTPIPTPPNPLIITQEAINRSFVVTNPAPRRIDNVVVDLQPDLVVISFDFTTRAPAGAETTTYAITATYSATVRNGRIYWTLDRATVDSEPASDEMVRQINSAMSSSWRNFVRSHIRAGRVTDVVITDDEIQIFYVAR